MISTGVNGEAGLVYAPRFQPPILIQLTAKPNISEALAALISYDGGKGNPMNRTRRYRDLFLMGLVVLLGFQNCSPSFQEPDNTDPRLGTLGDEDPQPEPTPRPATAQFRAGDPVSRNALGHLYTFELRALLDFAAYEAYSGEKAIALAPNGLAAVRFSTAASAAEVERAAIEACNAIAGQACALLMSGDTFKVDADKISADAQMLLKSGNAALVATDTPFLLDAQRVLVQNYLLTSSTSHAFKALALSPSGEAYSTYGHSQSEANRRALQICEYNAAITPCLIFAEGNQRVFNLANWDRAQRLRLFPAVLTQAEVPFIFDEDRPGLDPFFADLANQKIVALGIAQSGSYGAAQNGVKAEAERVAVERCSSGSSEACFLYSSVNSVELRWDRLPTKSVLRAVVCAVPRASCAAHKERGCAAATRWIANGGTLTRQSCN